MDDGSFIAKFLLGLDALLDTMLGREAVEATAAYEIGFIVLPSVVVGSQHTIYLLTADYGGKKSEKVCRPVEPWMSRWHVKVEWAIRRPNIKGGEQGPPY